MGYERKSLVELWLQSFSLINKCAGKLVTVGVISALLFVGILALAFLAIGGTAGIVKILQDPMLAKTAAIGGIILYVLFSIAMQFYWMFIVTVCARILSAASQEQTQPLYEAFSGAIIPSIYQVIASILISIPLIVVAIVLAIISHGSNIVMLIFLGAILLTIGVRLAYSYTAIMIGNKGPISCFVQSWEMTQDNYLDTLAFLIMTGATSVAIMLLLRVILIGLYKGIPLYFANSFSLTSPVWWLIGIVLAVLYGILYFIPLGFTVLVYLNRSGELLPIYQQAAPEDEFTPLPDSQLPPDLNIEEAKTITPQATVEEGPASMSVLDLPTQKENSSTAPTEKEPKKPVLDTLTPTDDVEISQVSVNTTEEDANKITQHLGQVYTPRKENIVDSTEDRMPTILFDDELAKQLRSDMEPKQKDVSEQSHLDEDSGSIKMSK